ncbi:molybdopterin-dependent oxidoreductase [Deinococcus metallilatus]|uniref:Oxidoreductase molybdopterin-binding domain-containing protein n=1 Tax=Deinococcus metallilatus TaxID=1211322 RepID=A0ABR6MVC5_9DEIO|nr:molybdopterin-dependent oxidoreductase [Deinococcus metallilatus]MBB5295888.1 hypothetical protein [Deinococcus metallilatus]
MRPTVRALLPALALLSGLALGAQPGEGSSAKWTPFPYLHLARPIPDVKPGETVLLTLEGQGRPQVFTRSQLLALPTVRYATEHAQLHRTFTYEGVPLRDLAVLGGFAGRDMRLYASNGFVTTIRARDYMTAPIMLAHTANGRPIPVLEKGPLAVVLPPDPQRFPARLYGAAWVWFVERITPVP